jgi:hypothetical protein
VSKKKPLEQPIDETMRQYFRSLRQPKVVKESIPDCYHHIRKLWNQQRSSKTVKKVPQLGEQSLPLFRLLSNGDEELAKFIKETDLTREQLLEWWISCQQKCIYCIIGTWSNLTKDVRCSLLLSMIVIF